MNQQVQEEISRLNQLKNQGMIDAQEYNHLLEQVLHRKSAIQELNAWSAEQKRQKILFLMALLGILSIVTGIGLIIGANWQVIPFAAKMAGGLALLAGTLSGAYVCHLKERPVLKELFLLASFFMIPANMALLQQKLQLAFSICDWSLIWWGLSLPLVCLSARKWLKIASVILATVGLWEKIELILEHVNYMTLCGLLSVGIFASFLGGQKMRWVRYISFIAALVLLWSGDIRTRDTIGLISTGIFVIVLLCNSGAKNFAVRMCNLLAVFIVWRMFLLFLSAYHNLMSMGVQFIVFGLILLMVSGGYYYYFDGIQKAFKKLVNHE